nr:unnamed protein product [Digitaria exilis]
MASTAAQHDEPTTTVVIGEPKVPRAVLWAVAVYLPSVYIAAGSLVAYSITDRRSPFFIAGESPWRAPALVMWGIYMAVVAVVMMHMLLFLPRAPMAACDAVVDVGWIWVGAPLCFLAVVAVCLDCQWMLVAVVCIIVLLIAALFAHWASLDRILRRAHAPLR